MTYTIAALYHFCELDSLEALQINLHQVCSKHHIKGTLLIADEGINGTICGLEHDINIIVNFISEQVIRTPLNFKVSYSENNPFPRLKVKLKKEIVTIGKKDVNPCALVGTYVEPADWNDVLKDSNTLVIDTRNDYETAIGTFKNATDPQTKTFREFPEYVKTLTEKKQRIAMFCTGGIRCEKASSLMLGEGFSEVLHLKGGILAYLEQVMPEDSMWQGECFVFDERVTVNHQLEPGSYKQCHGCRRPINDIDMQSEQYQLGVSCPHCYEETTSSQKERFRERQKQIELARERQSK